MRQIDPELCQGLSEAGITLVKHAIEEVDRRFGPDGERPLAYHGPEHTLGVIQAASDLGTLAIKNGKISQRSGELLIVAAAFHDICQLSPDGQNEMHSATEAFTSMRTQVPSAYSYPEEQVVCRAILATRMRQNPDGVLTQFMAHDSYVSWLMADADMATLGKPKNEYWKSVEDLFIEQNPGAEAKGPVWQSFVRFQQVFLNAHTFFTPEARTLFPHKEDNRLFAASKQSPMPY